MTLLQVEGLVTRFQFAQRPFTVVSDVSLEVAAGESVALVGESGCGKTMTLRSILQMLPPKAAVVAGSVVLNGRDCTRLPRRALRQIWGKEMAVIVQDPVGALNPVISIEDQLDVVLKQVVGVRTRRDRHRRAVDLLQLVGVPEPDRRLKSYPHELSTGMAQRVVIALALVGEPEILLADEPTNALDVSVQAQILRLLLDLQTRFGMALLLVTHDLGVVAQTARRMYVMYAGRIVEEGQTSALFRGPRHPYTAGLVSSVPSLDRAVAGATLPTIPGSPPNLALLPPGCRFAPRCALVEDECLRSDIPLMPTANGGRSACRRHDVVTRTDGPQGASPLNLSDTVRDDR
jgi:oligopeptide/dipeptide ABC transporter ATP-binding protein